MIPVATPSAEHRPDVPVDCLDLPEGDLLVAISEVAACGDYRDLVPQSHPAQDGPA